MKTPLLTFCCLLIAVDIFAADFVPPGFEELLEPQTTEVDIYFGDRYLLSTLATYTPNEVTFEDPGEIVDHIPDLLQAETIRDELGQPLSTNSELVCLKQNQSNCGKVEAETVEVIFDESRFRADLFVAPRFLAVRSAVDSKFLPPSSAGFSVLNLLSAAVNGQEGETKNYNIRNSTTVSYKETQLLGISNVTREEDLTFDTLAVQREFSGRQYQAGLFKSNAGNLIFLQETNFAGIRVGSSLDTRTDLDQSSGNELQLFLDSRSRVDIFKDGRLVSTGTYDTGNQIIDTSQLPDGAYDIELRIRDSSGSVREETRFYVKTHRLPPIDQTLFFFDAGELTAQEADHTLPQGTGRNLVRAGIGKRMSRSFGVEGGIVASEGDALLETGMFHLGRRHEFRLNGAVGDEDNYGVNINSRIRLGRARIHTNLRRTWTESTDSLIGDEITQGSLNLSVPIKGATLNLTGRYNERETGTDRNLGLRLDFAPYRFGNRTLDASFRVTRDNGSMLFLLGLRLRFDSAHWYNELAPRAYYERPEDQPGDRGLITSFNSTWQDQDRFLGDVRFTTRLVDERNDDTFETELDVASNYGKTNIEAIYSRERDAVSYGANYYGSFLANADTVSFGGKNLARSAMILDVEGEEDESYFDVRINQSLQGKAAIGDKTIFNLRPFETYKVELVPRGGSLINFNNQIKTVTLYPGNVVTLDWQTSRVVVAFGQVLDAGGKPIQNAVLDGVSGLATTDQFGLFQAELDSSVTELTARTRESKCRVALPDYDASGTVVQLGELTCR